MIPNYLLNIEFITILYTYTVAHFLGSFCISVVFQISHISNKNAFNTYSITDFATNQIETTHDYSIRSKLITCITGGLNFQVIHHLLPNVSQLYYLELHDTVDDICTSYDKSYTKSASMIHAIICHVKQIYNMSYKKKVN